MKRILYDMGLLTLDRWLLRMLLSLSHPSDQDMSLKIEKNKRVLSDYYAKSIVLCPCFFWFFFLISGKSAVATPTPPSGIFRYVFLSSEHSPNYVELTFKLTPL